MTTFNKMVIFFRALSIYMQHYRHVQY